MRSHVPRLVDTVAVRAFSHHCAVASDGDQTAGGHLVETDAQAVDQKVIRAAGKPRSEMVVDCNEGGDSEESGLAVLT
jgi:hypothetical protein